MKILIVEDEKHAREHLEKLLLELEPGLRVVAKLDSVRQTVAWLRQNNAPELAFFDIHLADDLSFSVFEQVPELATFPVIFTTAYDQYALRAFKVNSVDYLLKPIGRADLAAALKKFNQIRAAATPPPIDYARLADALRAAQNAPATAVARFQERFMVSRGEHLMSVPAEQVAWFEGEDRYVYLVKKDGRRFLVDYTLADLENLLDPAAFFRLNRSFIARFEAIRDILNLSKSRIKVTLEPPSEREVVVSADRNQLFKEWLNR